MMRSLYSGVSGLKTHQTKMDVIGNNIANVNTLAFKSSSTTFTDIMYQTTQGASGATATTGGRNAKQIGLGVINGATKVSITKGGSAQSTGESLDIRLNDSKSTNFFIVSNGTENLFTRSGSFYLDGNGNLAMTTTGYLVMGWQVNKDTNEIVKDTVSPLRLMAPENQTSAPEATTYETWSGIIDKFDTDVTSDNGYYRTMAFYDNLGYSYQAKFSVKVTDADTGTYTMELLDITNSDQESILDKWKEADPTNNTLAKLFGQDTTATKKYDPDSAYANLKYVDSGSPYAYDQAGIQDDGTGVKGIYFSNGVDPKVFKSLQEIYGVSDEIANGTGLTISDDGQLVRTYDTTNTTIQFNTDDGSLKYVGSAGNDTIMFNASVLGDAFADITMDFKNLQNVNNNGTSTVTYDRGDANTNGAGKKLGALTGIEVSGNGEIYGTYDNGNTVLLGQIPVAQFANASGLEALGDNCYTTTLNSGEFDGIGVDVTGDGGSMNTGQLEMSNVDLSAEFTDMIVTQRGFQANSRIITVSDTLLEELINLKR